MGGGKIDVYMDIGKFDYPHWNLLQPTNLTWSFVIPKTTTVLLVLNRHDSEDWTGLD